MQTEKTLRSSEKALRPINGYLILVLIIILVLGTIYFFADQQSALASIGALLVVFLAKGLVVINPNSAQVYQLFGAYVGTVKEHGLFWVNPFYTRRNLSMRARNFESEKIKVNDKLGNPVQISVILVWRVKDTFRVAFEVDNYESFIKVQTDAAVRKLAGSYPYDHYEDERASVTLSTNFDDVNKTLEQEISERLAIAGIEVIEARIGYLAYAPEIAHSMLRRQQATAVVAARHKIVEGAVSMVESALRLLSAKQIVDLDEDKKAAMVSNLMVVLCGDKDPSPVVNTGTLNQ